MASVNKVILVGNVVKDPEVRFSAQGEAMANLTVATSESWKDKETGEKKNVSEFHRVSIFGKLAEVVQQYVKKGAPLYLEGSLQTKKYTDKQGVEKYSTQIRATTMQMLGGRRDDAEQEGQHRTAPKQQASSQGGFGSDFEQDIPF